WPSVSHLSLSRTAFPGALLRPLSGRASCLARACGTSPSSDFSPSTGHPFAFWAYRCASAPRSLHAEHPMRSPGVTTCSSAPCRPHTPWFEGWMENAFVAIVPTRPCPLFGRPLPRRDRPPLFRPGASPQAPSDSPSRWTPSPPRSPSRPARRSPRLWIWRSPSEPQWDFNPPEHVAAQRTLRAAPPLDRVLVLSASRVTLVPFP